VGSVLVAAGVGVSSTGVESSWTSVVAREVIFFLGCVGNREVWLSQNMDGW
jgi:hypothetical protein